MFLEAQQNKIQANGSVIGIHLRTNNRTQTRSISPPESRPLLQHTNSNHLSQQTAAQQTENISLKNCQQQHQIVPQAAINEMRVWSDCEKSISSFYCKLYDIVISSLIQSHNQKSHKHTHTHYVLYLLIITLWWHRSQNF